jgi:4-hydroxysphinganine ceramide fatty acyl 2-hydroxylase
MLLPLIGKNIDEAFEDQGHTMAALKILKQLTKVGKVSYADTIKQDVDDKKLVDKWGFDLSKGLFWQLWNTNWTLKDYNDYVENPNTLLNPWRTIKIFDFFLFDWLTYSPWWSLPLCFAPIIGYHLTLNTLDAVTFAMYFCIGAFIWTFNEYAIHRFLFHSEKTWLPDHPWVIACHFVANGYHHAFP